MPWQCNRPAQLRVCALTGTTGDWEAVVDVRDAPTFDQFYRLTSARLLGQLTAMTADPEQAADVLQEAYAKAWVRWDHVSGLDNPEAWVRTVAWRAAVSRFRRWRVALHAQTRLARPDRVEDPDVSVAMDVRAALASLPAAQRQALVLHDLVGMSVEEVARETGAAVGTVKSRLSRGRASLSLLLADTTTGEESRHGTA